MPAFIRRMSPFACVLVFGGCADDGLPTTPGAPRSDVVASLAVASAGSVHSVTGSARSAGSGEGPYSQSISVHQDATGNVRGQSIARPDLTQFGLGTPTIFIEITCLVVDGNTAWYSGYASKVVGGTWPAVGEEAIGWVQDNGPGSADLAFSGPSFFWAPGKTCADRPTLPALSLVDGNFVVR